LISPEAETVEIRQLKAGKLERISILAEGSPQPSQFPEVTVSVPSLFPE